MLEEPSVHASWCFYEELCLLLWRIQRGERYSPPSLLARTPCKEERQIKTRDYHQLEYSVVIVNTVASLLWEPEEEIISSAWRGQGGLPRGGCI